MDPPASDVAETCAIENGACRVSMRERSSIIESGRFVYNCPIPSICGPWCFELFFGTSLSNVEYSDGTSVTSYVMQYVLLKPSIIFHTTGILVPFVCASETTHRRTMVEGVEKRNATCPCRMLRHRIKVLPLRGERAIPNSSGTQTRHMLCPVTKMSEYSSTSIGTFITRPPPNSSALHWFCSTLVP